MNISYTPHVAKTPPRKNTTLGQISRDYWYKSDDNSECYWCYVGGPTGIICLKSGSIFSYTIKELHIDHPVTLLSEGDIKIHINEGVSV